MHPILNPESSAYSDGRSDDGHAETKTKWEGFRSHGRQDDDGEHGPNHCEREAEEEHELFQGMHNVSYPRSKLRAATAMLRAVGRCTAQRFG